MKFCRTFAEKAWKQFGGRVYIFWGCRDTSGSLTASKFDFNAEFGRGTSYRDIVPEAPISDLTWANYLQQCYDGQKDLGDNEVHLVGSRGAMMDLPRNEMGEPVLPEESDWPSDLAAPARISWLKRLVRSFLSIHYGEPFSDIPRIIHIQMGPGLATDGRSARVPWTDILKNAGAFIDAEYLPDYDTLDSDPSHLSMPKVKTLLRYWRDRQKSEQIAFRFRYVLEGSERVRAKEPKRITPLPPSEEVPKGRGPPKPKKVAKKTGKRSKKGKARSKEIVSDSGEEFDFGGVDKVPFPEDGSPQSTPMAKVTPAAIATACAVVHFSPGTTADHTPDWRKAPLNLPISEINVWNKFIENLPDSCSSWTHEQTLLQFQVFKGWSANYPVPSTGIASLPKQGLYITPAISGDVDISLEGSSRDKGSGITAIPPLDSGIPSDKSKPTAALGQTSTPSQIAPKLVDVPRELRTPQADSVRLAEAPHGLGTPRGKGGRVVAEAPDHMRMLEDPGLADVPFGARTRRDRGEQPRTNNGKFANSLKKPKEPSNGKKRVREDAAESSADGVATEPPSPKKAKIDEPSTTPKRRGRSSKKTENPNGPGPSAPLTRSKAKGRKTRR
jgi:hypothetical protein